MSNQQFQIQDINTKYLNIQTDKVKHDNKMSLDTNAVRRSFKEVLQSLRKIGWLYVGHFPCQLLPMFDSGIVYLIFNLIFVLLVFAAFKYALNIFSMLL
ncbi:hypothetical protein HANVADRAFT_52235 [Hanseniaspora valbyensis NRRL Y-1626]|uniref:Uncharacterized protein n=1 Tax=Hanseniaspora valbyensis NRRL Y-1626 TaxID=766949 RepID=A0A1B7TFI1_9ASCO|nr:hypothetical protein HANVADRAFT_52235 [Hanseniaspora valbyensis NRRL Y-1626]